MHSIPFGEITSAVETFLRSPDGQSTGTYRRERSWDFCFNYFQENTVPTQDMELSSNSATTSPVGACYEGHRTYFVKPTRHYQATIEVIEEYNPAMRKLNDSQLFDSQAQQLILSAYADLRKTILPKGNSHLTLVTKVMMGVWGAVPSFDTYFIKGFRKLAEGPEKSAFSRLGSKSLSLLGHFYEQNRVEIDDLAQQYKTLNFATGQHSDRSLTRAKIIDMYGFNLGFNAHTLSPESVANASVYTSPTFAK